MNPTKYNRSKLSIKNDYPIDLRSDSHFNMDKSLFYFLDIFNNTNIAIASANNPNKITNEIAPNANKLICIPP